MTTRKNGNAKGSKAAEAKADEQSTEAAADVKPAEDVPEAIIAKVIHRFRDKDTLSVLQPGMTIAVSPERFEEICAAGEYLERA